MKSSLALKQREKVKIKHHLKSVIHFLLNLELPWNFLSQSHCQPNHTQTHTHTHRLGEQMNSQRHHRAGSVDDTHWKRAGPQREDGWVKCSCLPCFPHILITHYSDILNSEGGPRHWNTVVQSLLHIWRDWMAVRHGSTFSIQSG